MTPKVSLSELLMAESGLTPVAFFGHGSPTTIFDDPATMSAWSTLAGIIGRPKAIICVSAHWCTEGVKVTAMEAPRTIHDFGRGLPRSYSKCSTQRRGAQSWRD